MMKVILFVALGLILPSLLFADRPTSPVSYKYEVAGGQYLFVMLAPDQASRCSGPANKSKDDICIYPASGLYFNDGSLTPIWELNWYGHQQHVHVSSNGKHLVLMGAWPKRGHSKEEEMAQLAVAFYEKGSLKKKYTLGDLISDPKGLTYSEGYVQWKNNDSFYDFGNQFTIDTVEGKTYTFDATTGSIVKKTP